MRERLPTSRFGEFMRTAPGRFSCGATLGFPTVYGGVELVKLFTNNEFLETTAPPSVCALLGAVCIGFAAANPELGPKSNSDSL